MKVPRGLSDEEAELWARLARTVTPLAGRLADAVAPDRTPPSAPTPPVQAITRTPPQASKPVVPAQPIGVLGLDSHWERKLGKAALEPDYSLDLHGHTLDTAHARLDQGLAQARAMGARLVLVVTGRPRPVDGADRAGKRGAIRAKILDWLAAGPHADAIAAIRTAHRRHGGDGALYLVLKRPRGRV